MMVLHFKIQDQNILEHTNVKIQSSMHEKDIVEHT